MENKDKSPTFHIRTDYTLNKLDENVLPDDPFKLFDNWMHLAINSKIQDPNAFSFSTADKSGQPRSRIVLLRDYSERGFSFFTNYNSSKGKTIEVNPKVCMSFFWPELQQQIRIDGEIVKVSEAESDEYFDSRPKESQLGAWASSQSEVLSSREKLEADFNELQTKYKGKEIPRPQHWGGYLIIPTCFEFWQGRASRLHDRIEYNLDKSGIWIHTRLYP